MSRYSPAKYIRLSVLAMTQQKLAKTLGVNQSTVSDWERNDCISLRNMRKIRRLARRRVPQKWSDSLFFEPPEDAAPST